MNTNSRIVKTSQDDYLYCEYKQMESKVSYTASLKSISPSVHERAISFGTESSANHIQINFSLECNHSKKVLTEVVPEILSILVFSGVAYLKLIPLPIDESTCMLTENIERIHFTADEPIIYSFRRILFETYPCTSLNRPSPLTPSTTTTSIVVNLKKNSYKFFFLEHSLNNITQYV